MKTSHIALLLSTALLCGCVRTPRVERLDQSNGSLKSWSGEGMVYALPKTSFDVTFNVTKTTLEAPKCGPTQYPTLADLKAKLHELDLDPETNTTGLRTIHSIDSAKLETTTIPDPKAVFLSQIPQKAGTSSLKVSIAEEGTVSGYDTSRSSQALAVTTKTLEFVASVVGAAIPLGAATPATPAETSDCDAAVTEYTDLKELLSNYRTEPTPQTAGALKIYQQEIRTEMARRQAFFLGKPKVQRVGFRCRLAPDSAGSHQVLQFNQAKGFASGNAATCDIPASLAAPANTSGTPIALKMTLVSEQPLKAALEKGPDTSRNADAGFFYRVPALAWASLEGHKKIDGTPLRLIVPQLGVIRSLPRVKGTNPSLTVELHPTSGALKSVTITHKSADVASTLSTVGTGAAGILTAIKARDDAAAAKEKEDAAKQDALAVSTYQQGLIESELAIEIAKRALAELP